MFGRIGGTNELASGDPRTAVLIDCGATVPSKYWANSGEVDDNENPIYINDFVELVGDMPEGSWVIQDDGTFLSTTTEAEVIQSIVERATTFIAGYIQSYIDTYNAANGVVFTNVHNCKSYADEGDNYPHSQFCYDIWKWNVEVWKSARGVQESIIAAGEPWPTEEEFIEMLPEYTGVS